MANTEEDASTIYSILEDNKITTAYRLTYLGNQYIGPVYRWVEKEFGIRRPHFATLFCLAHLGPLSARDVCELSGIPKNNISRAVADLAKRKCVRKSQHASDGRREVLQLTAEGKKLYNKILPRFQQRERSLLAPLTADEVVLLNGLLKKLVLRDDGWREEF